jgi:hypothetical protein
VVLIGLSLSGCGQKSAEPAPAPSHPPPVSPAPQAKSPAPSEGEPRLISNFDLKIGRGAKEYQLTFTYRGKEELVSPVVWVRLVNSNSVTSAQRAWPRWQPGEEKIVDAPRDAGAWIREVHLQGGGYVRLPEQAKGQGERFELIHCAGRWSGEKK